MSQRCLDAIRSSMLTFRVLSHWVSRPSHMTWYSTCLHYTDTGLTSSDSLLYFLYPISLADQNKYFANSVDPDETAHNEPSHQDQQCLRFWFDFSQRPVFGTMVLTRIKKKIEESFSETQGWNGLCWGPSKRAASSVFRFLTLPGNWVT